MLSEGDLDGRRQKAAEMILESEIVTAALEDDEAEVLLNWALAQVESYALSSKDMADEEAQEHIHAGVGKVRRLMRIVNDLVEDKDDLSVDEMVEELTHLLSLATEGRPEVAAEMIPETETVTSAAEDHDEIRALGRPTVQVEDFAFPSEDAGHQQAQENTGEGVDKSRLLMSMANDLVEEKDHLSPIEMVERLTHLLSLAMEGLSS